MFNLKNTRIEIIFMYFLIIFSAIISPTFLILNKNETYTYIIKPVIWICLLLITILFDLDSRAKLNRKKELLKTVFIATLLYVITYYILGIFLGYKKSPYLFDFFSISKNIWAIAMVACVQEYVRNTLISNTNKKYFKLILVTLVFILIDINFATLFRSFVSGKEAFKYICSTLLPLIVKNIAYTYISYYLGCFGSIINRCIILFVSLISPITPDTGWFFEGVINIVFYALLMLTINYETMSKTSDVSKRLSKVESPIKQLPLLVFSGIFILFIIGVFKYKPVAVMSNSMVPTFCRGYVVIVEKIDENNIEKLKVGDIIEYTLDKKSILHRIVSVDYENETVYITKGDNNSSNDKKEVHKNQIRGIVRLGIPGVGYPSVWFSEFINKSNIANESNVIN